MSREVAHPAECHVSASLREGSFGVCSEGYTCEFSGVTTGEFCTDDVGVFGEFDEEIGVHVYSCHCAGVVVEDYGEDGGGCYFDEVVIHRLLIHESAEVTWWE